MGKIFKILSLDGGGIKGLYTARLLANFEEKYKCKIKDKFNMICGTSTGGIIALGLTIGIPAKDIAAMYEKNGPNILSDGKWYNRIWLTAKQILFNGKYDASLGKHISKILGEKTMADCENIVCIPSFSMKDGNPFVFKNEHKDVKMRDVALATTYFHKIMESCEGSYVDGGIWANNPSLYATL